MKNILFNPFQTIDSPSDGSLFRSFQRNDIKTDIKLINGNISHKPRLISCKIIKNKLKILSFSIKINYRIKGVVTQWTRLHTNEDTDEKDRQMIESLEMFLFENFWDFTEKSKTF